MNLNDFMVLPNNTAKSVKLNVRNLQELQMETVTLAQDSIKMEEKLQQLKESMSKEKAERGHSGGFKWKSGHSGSLNSNALTNSAKKNKENRLQKLSTGKVKIRVLKNEPLTAPVQPQPPPLAPTTGLRTTRKNRLRGTVCGQCEVKTAGIMCAECTENYCVGCFVRFHQKGALQLHRMIPIQTDLQTHVSTQDVVSCFQKQMNNSSSSSTPKMLNPGPNPKPMHSANTRPGDQSPEKGPEAATKPKQMHSDPSQVLVVNHGKEKKVETEEEPENEDRSEFLTSLLRGEYSEEESARSFQEALRQWRGEKSDGAEEPLWIPVQPVSVSAIATQADLPPDRGAEGRGAGGGEGRVTVKVEFTETSLTYMDRLLLKKHRRTPVETYHTSLASDTDLKSVSNTNTEEETACNLTAQEEDFRHYYASLFAVPVTRGRTEPRVSPPESCLVIEGLDEMDRDINGVFVALQKTGNRTAPSVQLVSSNGRTLVPQTNLTSGGSSRVTSPRPAQPPKQFTAAAQPKATQKLYPSKSLTSQAAHSLKSLPSKIKPSACPTAETPRTSKTSIRTQVSKSQKQDFTPTVHKPKAEHGSLQLLSSGSLPHSQIEIPKSSKSPPSFTPDVSVQPNLSPQLSQSPPSNLESPKQSQHSLHVPEFLLSDNQSQCHLSPVSCQPNPQPKSLEPSPSVKSISSLFSESSLDTNYRCKSTSACGDFPDSVSSTPISVDHKSVLSHQDTQCVLSLPSHFLNVTQNPPLAVKMEEEEELSVNSGDEMSSDSLGLARHEGDSSEEEAQMHECLTRYSEIQRSPAMSHLGDPFAPEDAGQGNSWQSDEPEQPPEPSMMIHSQSPGSGSEQLCGRDGFTPLDLDLNSGPEVNEPSSSLSAYGEEHLVFRMMKDKHMQPTGIQNHSTTPTRRGEVSANETGTSELGPQLRPLSRAAQEIMEICSVDQAGCEDPDLDADATVHTLRGLEQELRQMAKEIGTQSSVLLMVDSGGQDQHGNQRLTRGRVSEEQQEEEEATQRDRQSVLLLP
uniref:B box-type domain-containing protein n=1 Tax=Monopterus albus TaxID=43700 RepID=A0A3Q3J286_MONAL|nr:zinc finger B-box domain-containing protein 1 isoform X2 [Monopterus albus]